jgi:hypothetical protein
MHTFTRKCSVCGDEFTYQRATRAGHPRLYCEDCRPRRGRGVINRIEQIVIEVRRSLARVNATLDRIEARHEVKEQGVSTRVPMSAGPMGVPSNEGLGCNRQ